MNYADAPFVVRGAWWVVLATKITKGRKNWEWGMGNVANWESRHLGGCGRGAINPSICIMRLHTIDVFAQIGRGVCAHRVKYHVKPLTSGEFRDWHKVAVTRNQD